MERKSRHIGTGVTGRVDLYQMLADIFVGGNGGVYTFGNNKIKLLGLQFIG